MDSNTYENFMKLISKGPKVRCSMTGQYFFLSETNSDGKGGRVAKAYDWRIHDQTIEQTKDKEGPGYFRGNKFTIPQVNKSQVPGLVEGVILSGGPQLYVKNESSAGWEPYLVTAKAV